MNLYLRKNSHLTVRLSSLGFLVNQGEVQDAIIQDGRELYVVKKKKKVVCNEKGGILLLWWHTGLVWLRHTFVSFRFADYFEKRRALSFPMGTWD